MKPALSYAGTNLDLAAMKTIARRNGPFITIEYPGYHPGASEVSRRTVLRDLVRTAQDRLKTGPLASHQTELAESLTRVWLDAEALRTGGPGGVIFVAPDFVSEYSLRGRQSEQLAIASHPNLTPFLAQALAAREFLILDLNRKRLRLIDYAYGVCTHCAWPSSIPSTLDEFGGFDYPDHDLQNRSAAGTSTGRMRGVQFGTMSDREAAGEYLHHFFAAVDRGLAEVSAGKLVLLGGVHEEVAAFRRAATSTRLLQSEITGSLEFAALGEIATAAQDAALDHYYKLGEGVLAAVAELRDRRRSSTEIDLVLEAAASGRVHQLCVREETEFLGRLNAKINKIGLDSEDLINAAVVETLRTGGEVFALPAVQMTTAKPLVALLRY
jgi:hypothetical protein